MSPTTSDAGPDQTINSNTTTLNANTPIAGTGSWSIIIGIDGIVSQPNNANSSFSGIPGGTYFLTWTISTGCAISVDTLVISLSNQNPGIPCPGIPSFTYGGQTYNTVQIGNQCQMRENLNIGTMVTSIGTSTAHSDCSNNGIIEKYCYNNDTAICSIYGGLYDWDEMMGYTSTVGGQGICPTGWHLPTDAEWCTLTIYLDATVNCTNFGWSGTNVAGKLKETGFSHWSSPNTGASNESGFAALGAGYRYSSGGSFQQITWLASFWSSSEATSIKGITRWLDFNYSDIERYSMNKKSGCSVRCVKDD